MESISQLRTLPFLLLSLTFFLSPLHAVAKEKSASAKEGAVLYSQTCVFCHQADAIGKPGMAPALSNPEFLSLSSDTFLKNTIKNGRTGTGMPPFSYLSDEKVDHLVQYLRSFETKKNVSAKINIQPDAHGDPRLGELWFDQICSTCHGPKGNGYQAGGTGTAIGSIGFLNSASDGFIRETIKHGRSNTRMKAFQGPDALADLSDGEIDDIITYLRSLHN